MDQKETKNTEITIKLTPEAINQLLSLSNDFQISSSKVVENALTFVSFYKDFFKEGFKHGFSPITQIKNSVIETKQKELQQQESTLNEIIQLREKTRTLYDQMIQQEQQSLSLKQGKVADDKRKREREIQRQKEQLERLIRKNMLDEKRDDKQVKQDQEHLKQLTNALTTLSKEIDQQLTQYHSDLQKSLSTEKSDQKKGKKFGKIKMF